MAENFPKYKYLKVSLSKNPDKSFFVYSVYEDESKLNFIKIDSTEHFEIYGVASDSDKDSYKENLFEYNINATGVFEKLRVYETKNYFCKYQNITLSVQNEKELEPVRSAENQFSFKVINYLGKSVFNVETGENSFSLPFEIIPVKFDYEDDYVQLTDDIADKCSQLLLDYSSPVNLNFNHNLEKIKKSPLEMFIFIRKFCSFQNIEYLMQCIKSNPDRMLVSENEMKPFGTAPVSKNFFANPFSNGKNWQKIADGIYLPEQIATCRKYDSYNTPANQFIKFAFNAFIQVCQDLIDQLDGNYSYKDEAEYLKQTLENILLDSFFDDVQNLSSMPFNNHVLQKREGYARVFNAFNMLDLAQQLDWEGQKKAFEGQARNIALLYEYWLVFELIKILKNLGTEFDFDIQKDKDVDHMISLENGLLISLKQGRTSLISGLLKDKGLKIKFYYNRTFSKKEFNGTDYQGSYSRDFRPDYTLSIYPAIYDEKQAIASGEVSFIHFDAKYRVSDITALFGKEKSDDIDFDDEKKSETVNTYNRGDLLKMHTYNDAIRKTIGSYVLYPGKTDEANKFHVYDELLPGVGAFAIRPGDKEHIGEKQIELFISDVINFKSHVSSRQYRKEYFENMVINSPSEGKTLPVEESEKAYQMIGFIRNEYLSFLTSNNIIPVTEDEFKSNSNKFFYFYFYAIKNGKVYAIHKETSKAKYLRLTNTDINDCKVEYGYKFQHLLPWEAEIQSMELVSKETLIERLNELYTEQHFVPKDGFHADYYYLVKATITQFIKTGISAVSTTENEDISVYSPKIIERIF